MLKFFTGTLDAAYFGSTPFLLGYAYGLPVRTIGIAQRLGKGHAVVTRGAIPTRPRIGTVSGSTGHEIAHAWASASDRTPVFVDLPPNDQIMAFKAGFIDGISCWEPFTSMAVRLGGTRIFTAEDSGTQLNLLREQRGRTKQNNRPAVLPTSPLRCHSQTPVGALGQRTSLPARSFRGRPHPRRVRQYLAQWNRVG